MSAYFNFNFNLSVVVRGGSGGRARERPGRARERRGLSSGNEQETVMLNLSEFEELAYSRSPHRNHPPFGRS